MKDCQASSLIEQQDGDREKEENDDDTTTTMGCCYCTRGDVEIIVAAAWPQAVVVAMRNAVGLTDVAVLGYLGTEADFFRFIVFIVLHCRSWRQPRLPRW